MILMLAPVPRGVERESVGSCRASTFPTRLKIQELQGQWEPTTTHLYFRTRSANGVTTIQLVGLSEDGTLFGRPAAENAGAGSTGLLDGETAKRRFGDFFDLLFTLAITAPEGLCEAGLNGLSKLIKILWRGGMSFAEGQGAIKQGLLNLGQQLLNGGDNAVLGYEALAFLARPVTTSQHDTALGNILRSDFHPQRNAAHFPVIKLEAWALSFALVDFDAQIGLHKLLTDFFCGFKD